MDIELSLDDIIQKKGLKSNQRRGRNFRNPGAKKNENNNNRSKNTTKGAANNKNVGNTKNVGNMKKSPKRPVIQDARNKIIQKSRMKITDAREKLVELAKQSGDARLKLNKLQERKQKTNHGPRKQPFPGRPRQKSALILRSIDPSVTDPSIKIIDDDDMNGSSVFDLKRTINNRLGGFGLGSFTARNDVIDLAGDEDDANQMMPYDRLLRQSLPRLKIVAQNQPIQSIRSKPNGWGDLAQAAGSRLGQSARGHLYSDDMDMLGRGGGAASSRLMSQEMRSRLDMPTSPVARSMHPAAAAPSMAASSASSQGHRIVVSNLHPKVTHEDIKELFGELGQLIASHVVRPGTAEVIYMNQKDAIAAVDAYHNRTLDGQPMKCMLVNPRPTALNPSARPKYPSSTKSQVMPDISAIHKALFSK
ncbi:polymerase delta-interacting protein 3 isoform X2 [Nilaparvata lugens]|uniref:polymerase delta-interacting protein 3 isoform X2 n=1 Tax=Nilaparvata lugens TaxID=108931 RepID=UPI00193E34D1|nr:polymerase delta-interacting protein 3 isoform X2 [Nilaparvata lugens]